MTSSASPTSSGIPHAVSLPSIDELLISHEPTTATITTTTSEAAARLSSSAPPIHSANINSHSSPTPNRRRHRRSATDNTGGRVLLVSRKPIFSTSTNNASFATKQRIDNKMSTLHPTYSYYSTTNANANNSTHSNSNSITTTTALKSTALLGNMMQSHKNRNPYNHYIVLGCLGKGSIGSVEKVVRKHNRAGLKLDKTNSSKFNSYGNAAANKNSGRNTACNNYCCFGRFFSKLFGGGGDGGDGGKQHKDAFQSTIPPTNNNNNDNTINNNKQNTNMNNISNSNRTISSTNSESSAFSAPSTTLLFTNNNTPLPTTTTTTTTNITNSPQSSSTTNNNNNNNNNNKLLSTSHHGFHLFSTSAHPHGIAHKPQHPLRRYALKSIRLDRTTTTTGTASSSSFPNLFNLNNNSKGNNNDSNNENSITSAISPTDEAELRNEISILRSLDHPHIVRCIETYEYKRMIYMVLDLCEGGDLYVMDPYGEGEAKEILRQLFGAVGFMHRRGIVHRDLKYENVMFVDQRAGRSKLEIKLIDFGLSKKYGKTKGTVLGDKIMTDFVGTIYTMSPEVLRGSYNYKCDLWSLGVMAYMLLSSQIPFCGKDMQEIAKKIMRGTYNYSGKRWSQVSRRSKDFVSSLLVRDATSRPTADQALRHRWFTGTTNQPINKSKTHIHRRHSSDCLGGTVLAAMMNDVVPQQLLDSQICTSIENFATYSWLHRLALMVIAYRFTAEETSDLRWIFASFDGDHSGTVEVDELRRAFCLHDKYSDEEIDQIFLAVDMNGAGKISWTEFLAATIETKGRIGEEEFADAFERLDFDKNGYIGVSDIRQIVGRDLPQSIIDQIIDESDITRDHKIWKDEFLALAGETCATDDIHQRKSVRIILKRSNSADDFDLVQTRSIDSVRSDLSELLGDEQFCIEKAKSVRKKKQIF